MRHPRLQGAVFPLRRDRYNGYRVGGKAFKGAGDPESERQKQELLLFTFECDRHIFNL